MHSNIMCELHIVPILVDVNSPVKYSVWDAEVMKCYFLPLISSFLCSVTEVAQLCQQYYSYLGWIN